MMLKVWGRRNSINVMKVLWICDELNLPVEQIDAGLHYGLVNTPEYAAMNPNRRVPTIDDHGTVLFESNVICRYLAAKHQREDLLPADLQQRFFVERWMDWASFSISQGMTPLFWQLIRTPPEKRNADTITSAIVESERCMRIINEAVAKGGFMHGDYFTLADVPCAAFVHRWLKLPIEHAVLPAMEDYYQRMLKRAAYQKHVALDLT
ncbi:MAG: glutathione S-transferase family protein [Betaproteobacteria bacterium]|nr:glutathione S-transferase family protein [Betaproteobacteria bacterium]NDA71456.1 glutathione S-transferase family protein [Betaproteobacteria bacterium]